jgi:uncharacterized phage-like protein YoqJ
MSVIAVTGHRPQSFEPVDFSCTNDLWVRISRAMENAFELLGATKIISGGALGVDTAAMELAVSKKIPFDVYVPCRDQEKRWRPEQQKHYLELLTLAENVKLIHNGPYNFKCMQDRNEAMVNDADIVLAVWNGKESGGTYNCVQYACEQWKSIYHIDTTKKMAGWMEYKGMANA